MPQYRARDFGRHTVAALAVVAVMITALWCEAWTRDHPPFQEAVSRTRYLCPVAVVFALGYSNPWNRGCVALLIVACTWLKSYDQWVLSSLLGIGVATDICVQLVEFVWRAFVTAIVSSLAVRGAGRGLWTEVGKVFLPSLLCTACAIWASLALDCLPFERLRLSEAGYDALWRGLHWELLVVAALGVVILGSLGAVSTRRKLALLFITACLIVFGDTKFGLKMWAKPVVQVLFSHPTFFSRGHSLDLAEYLDVPLDMNELLTEVTSSDWTVAEGELGFSPFIPIDWRVRALEILQAKMPKQAAAELAAQLYQHPSPLLAEIAGDLLAAENHLEVGPILLRYGLLGENDSCRDTLERLGVRFASFSYIHDFAREARQQDLTLDTVIVPDRLRELWAEDFGEDFGPTLGDWFSACQNGRFLPPEVTEQFRKEWALEWLMSDTYINSRKWLEEQTAVHAPLPQLPDWRYLSTKEFEQAIRRFTSEQDEFVAALPKT